MDKRKIVNSVIMLMTLALTASCGKKQNDYAAYVDPFVGTGGHGHVYPGAVVPYPMIQPSPDTRVFGWDACAGYHYSDTTINGFSQTHLSGTGCSDYGDILIMPVIGTPAVIDRTDEESQQMPYASPFSHENETAEPGYYSVMLDTYGIKAEITATQRTAIYRFTFPQTDSATLIVDLDYNLDVFGIQRNDILALSAPSDTVIQGSKQTKGWAWEQAINFYAVTSQPFTCKLYTDTITTPNGKEPRAKAILTFPSLPDNTLLVKIALSGVDTQGAAGNMQAEMPGWQFDEVRKAARDEWNKALSRVEVETTDTEAMKIFYTSLYRASLCPNLFTDIDGRYMGMDRKIHTTDRPIYTIFSLWDTFRAYHPMMTIIDPKLNADFVNSLVEKYKEGGALPMWELASNYTATMIGYNAVSVITDAYIKGTRDFDIEAAYAGMKKSSNGDTTGIIVPRAFMPYLQPESKRLKERLGYVPCDKENEAVAKALEYAYDDWCISVFAAATGHDEDTAAFAQRGRYYKNYYDASTGFMRGKDSKGKWRTPFNPYASNHRDDDYCEGIAWQWTWFVPHDVQGLVDLMGGKEAFVTKLDSLFYNETPLQGDNVSADISGLIGLYAHGNEPSHHIAHLYNYVGYPEKTQAMLDSILYSQYRIDPDGISGNEDCGQMSAWYILNSIGIYQVAPGNPVYSIGRPIFDHVAIPLESGKTFTITVNNNTRQNKYIQKAELNGTPLAAPFITHEDIMSGGQLVLDMGSAPSQIWKE